MRQQRSVALAFDLIGEDLTDEKLAELVLKMEIAFNTNRPEYRVHFGQYVSSEPREV